MLKIAILDDYAKVALQSADWSVPRGKAEITVFDRHLSENEAATLLQPFDVFCTVRERMSLPRSLFQRLPKLKLAAMGGALLLAAWGVYPHSADSLFEQAMCYRRAKRSLLCDRDACRKEDIV